MASLPAPAAALPPVVAPSPLSALPRALKHPRAMHHHRLAALVLGVNLVVLLAHHGRGDWHLADGSALGGLADLVLLNLAGAVLVRQQHLLNLVFGLAGRGSPRWPLRVRWCVSKINHIGGLHVGAALAGADGMLGIGPAALGPPGRAPGPRRHLALVRAGSL